ncbi:hypothetical protein CRENBAI_024821 [Crenichthys baileyi]|uniref:Uncharacterized protein n=1 Tax=Crenichthys baileyi TaxID=28760 RepID=A0AAV9S9D2_9TELE
MWWCFAECAPPPLPSQCRVVAAAAAAAVLSCLRRCLKGSQRCVSAESSPLGTSAAVDPPDRSNRLALPISRWFHNNKDKGGQTAGWAVKLKNSVSELGDREEEGGAAQPGDSLVLRLRAVVGNGLERQLHLTSLAERRQQWTQAGHVQPLVQVGRLRCSVQKLGTCGSGCCSSCLFALC